MPSLNSIEVIDENFQKIKEALKSRFKLTFDDYGKCFELNIQKEELDYVMVILTNMKNRLEINVQPEIVDLTREIFRSLRNYMIGYTYSHNFFTSQEKALLDTKEILLILINSKHVEWSICINIIFQFLINLIVSNENSAEGIWSLLSDVFLTFFNNCNAYYTCAFLYNILIRCSNLQLNFNIQEKVLQYFEDKTENEYVIFLIVFFLKHDHVCEKYIKFQLKQRIILLEMIKLKIIIEKDETFTLSQKQVLVFTSEYKKKSDCILRTDTAYANSIDVREIVLLLDVIASLTSSEQCLYYLQNDKGLLINCMYLLRGIHEAGKQGNELFIPFNKVSQMNSSEPESAYSFFNLKANLIRILGNMCWNHKVNQNCVREMEGIAILLDCCNIDAKNPFIIQWIVLAVRNLCENNKENQKLISNLKQQLNINTQFL